MVIFRCTKKLLIFLDISPSKFSVVPRAIFGEWYVNIVPTFRGESLLFVNDPTLLTVVLPLGWGSDLESNFRERVLDLYDRLSFPKDVIIHESNELESFSYTKSESLSFLGSMNAIARHLQSWAQGLVPGSGDTLQSFELAMSQMPHKRHHFKYPIEIAHILIKKRENKQKK